MIISPGCDQVGAEVYRSVLVNTRCDFLWCITTSPLLTNYHIFLRFNLQWQVCISQPWMRKSLCMERLPTHDRQIGSGGCPISDIIGRSLLSG